MATRRSVLALFLVMLAGSILTAQPASPAAGAAPAWSRVISMPDGRTFISDGAIMIDMAIVKPATVPTVRIPPEGGKAIANFLTAPHKSEAGLGDLRPGTAPNTFATPVGIAVSATYVNYLRSVLPAARTRLLIRGPLEPIAIVTDGNPVGVVMPVAPPR